MTVPVFRQRTKYFYGFHVCASTRDLGNIIIIIKLNKNDQYFETAVYSGISKNIRKTSVNLYNFKNFFFRRFLDYRNRSMFLSECQFQNIEILLLKKMNVYDLKYLSKACHVNVKTSTK